MLPRQTEWKSMTFGMAWSVLENFMFFVMNKHEPSSLKRVFLEFLEFQVRLRFFIWARQNVIESKWNSWSLIWPGNSILEQKIVHVIASYLAIHMKILEKCISHKCFLLLWFIGGEKLKWILKNFIRISFYRDTTASSMFAFGTRSDGPWIRGPTLNPGM